MIDQLIANWRKLLSYLKPDWNLDDYPLRYKKQRESTEVNSLGEIKPWVVQIINWWSMTGVGDSKEEAYRNLKSNFGYYKQTDVLPRPGSNVPLKFADTSKVNELEEFAPEFFERILEINYYDCFISDESSLANFGKDDIETMEKINSVYDLGLTELGNGNIVHLLTLIKERRS